LLNYLPEYLKDSLYKEIASIKDPDNPMSMTEIIKRKASMMKWETTKQNLVENIRKS
jgi:hypothetical protein